MDMAGLPNAMGLILAREGRGVNGADEGWGYWSGLLQKSLSPARGFPPSLAAPPWGAVGGSANPLILRGFLQVLHFAGEGVLYTYGLHIAARGIRRFGFQVHSNQKEM